MEVDQVPCQPGPATAMSSKEGDGSLNSVMATPNTASSVTVSLHPLIIMNVSEHWTRSRAQNDGKPSAGL